MYNERNKGIKRGKKRFGAVEDGAEQSRRHRSRCERGKKRGVITQGELRCGQHCAVSPCCCTLFYYFLIPVYEMEHNAWAKGVNTSVYLQKSKKKSSQ